MFKKLFYCICFLFCVGLHCGRADVLPIQSFKTPSGLELWLVEDHTSPIVSLILTFDKSALGSPDNPSSLLLRQTMIAGAGILTPLEMDRFSKETPSWSYLSMGFSRSQLYLKTTKKGLKENLILWSRLLGQPQFQKADLAYSKNQAISTASFLNEDLETLALLNLMKIIFPDISIDTNFLHMPQIIETLTIQDLEKEAAQYFLGKKPKIVVVGDVDKKELIELIDSTFGALSLPSRTPPKTVFHPQWTGKDILIEKDIPQTIIALGQPGINPKSKEYPVYLLLQKVLSTRLFDELREKRGLIYAIQFYESHYHDVDLLTGILSCECSQALHVTKFIRSEWERLRDFGITQRELSDAKLSFKKSHILNLTSTQAVASEYAALQACDLSPHAAMDLLDSAEKVTLNEINQFVKDVLKPELLTFALIGSSLNPTHSKGKK